jgi:hypothetical protein
MYLAFRVQRTIEGGVAGVAGMPVLSKHEQRTAEKA